MIHIAIDGPAAAGKGTITGLLSKELGVPALDTGAIYRGIAVYFKENSIPPEDSGDLNFDGVLIAAHIVGNTTRIILNGADVTEKLRDNEISQIASKVGTIPAVRKLATRISQDIAERQSLIAEGRDICSVVLPNAKYKFYLTAKPKERAKRRFLELTAKGQKITFRKVYKEIKERDKRDMKKGGLVKTCDAIVVDSTDKTVDQVTAYMLKYISE